MKAAAQREVEGGEVLHLEVGQPMTPAPGRVLEAARRGLTEDRLGYTAATGLVSLRERIGCFYGERYGLEVSPDRVVMTIGASAGFVLACLALFDPGDRVAMTVPGYSAYRNVLTALGLELVEVRVEAETRFVPSVERLQMAGPLDGLVVASPSNPTGVTLTAAEMRSVAHYCSTTGTALISDEIYHGIDYGERAASALAFSESAVVVQSFSKYFSMTGWRLGWLVVPPELFRPLERLAQNLFIAPPTISQLGALEAFDCIEEVGRQCRRLCRAPGNTGGGTGRGGYRPDRPTGRRLLCVRRCLPSGHGLCHPVRSLAGGDRGGGHPRNRLRSGAGGPLGALVVL